jgi:hypothetical protein
VKGNFRIPSLCKVCFSHWVANGYFRLAWIEIYEDGRFFHTKYPFPIIRMVQTEPRTQLHCLLFRKSGLVLWNFKHLNFCFCVAGFSVVCLLCSPCRTENSVDLNTRKNNFSHCPQTMRDIVCYMTDKNRVVELQKGVLTKRMNCGFANEEIYDMYR